MNMHRIMVLNELLDDDFNLNIVFEAANHLVQPVANNNNNVPPQRGISVRNEDYFETVIPNYTLDDFKAHFRMSRNTFQLLLNQLLHIRNAPEGENSVPFQKKLLFTIWMLAKPESFIAAGDRFNMAKSTSHLIFFEVVSLITTLRHNIITWPNDIERIRINRRLHNRSGIPGIIGAIDGCHIGIKGPPHNAIDYYNRNSYHSVVLQGVCNDKKQFIDIFVGMPGRVHDSRVFRTSPLYNTLTGVAPPITAHEHLLGDAAYPLLPFLLKPYRDNGHLTNAQTTFNTRLSSVRSMIEQAFALLKGKFRRLKYLDMSRLDMIPSVITAGCVLHNIIISNDGLDRGEYPLDQEQNRDAPGDEVQPNNDVAARKRDYIAALLN
ncbi:hypothetical protein RI129_002560 [Pyrocoelia pectoralis]|uniref:DDE Tnp4 domain-containing protein n=1 Tax=Pyrocoelia pectoralis TaxID=417401 RepID=A0AAN7VN35_9COLE